MLVYVESNYLLELAFEQEEVGDCIALLELAETKQVSLVLPAFSIGECLERIGRRKSQRLTIQRSLREEIRELGRSASSATLSDQLRSLTDSLIAGADADEQRYDSLLRRLLGCAHFVPLDADVVRSSLGTGSQYGLSPQDAIVLTCVLSHLNANRPVRALFVNRNRKDFSNPDIIAILGTLQCVLKVRFSDGIAFLRADLARGTGTADG
jgi:predicted nucleic acid-binding protein